MVQQYTKFSVCTLTVTVRSKFSLKMAERYDCQLVLELLFEDRFELFDSSDSKEEDAGVSSYLGDKPLDSE